MKKQMFDLAEYEPLQQAKAALEVSEQKVAQLRAELHTAKAQAQSLEEEAIRLGVLAEIGEAQGRVAEEAKTKATVAQRAVRELEEALRRAELEWQVKADLVKQKDAEARRIVSDSLRDAHKRAVRKLADLLAQAVEVNQEVKRIQDRWGMYKYGGGRIDGLPGNLVGMHWPELLPEQYSKYWYWLRELERYERGDASIIRG